LKLGRSETIGAFDESFTVVDKTSKIYAKKLRAARAPLIFGRAAQNSSGGRPRAGTERNAAVIVPDLRGEADRLLLERAPVGVLVNEDMDIVEFRGRTVPYLEPAPGEASLNLLKMAHGGLALDIRAACREARKQNAPVRREGLQIDREGRLSTFNLEVIPMASAPARERHFLVLFEERAQTSEIDPTKPSNEKTTKRPARSESALLRRLRQELAATKQNLRAIIEELEGANEELNSLNEEALSTNEELQSTNEELETAKEELQSTNEELMTVNDQLQSRNLEVTQISNDLENLFESVAAPILMLDQNLRIRRFTPAAAKMLDLIATDIGRHFGDLRHGLDVSDLETTVLGVINSVSAKELEVRDRTGRWYLLRIHPYTTSEKDVEGAVVMFFDVDDLKRSLDTAEAARQYAEAIIATVREPLLVLDASLRVVKANRSFYEAFAVSPADTEQKLVYELGNHQWDIPKLRDLLERVLPNKSQFEGFEMEHDFPVIGLRKMILNARRIRHDEAGDQLILLAIEDVTEHARAEEALRVNEAHSRRLADAMPEMAWSARPDGYVDYYNERWYEFTRLPRGEWGDASWVSALDPEHVERVRQGWYGGALLSGERFEIEARFRDPAAGGYRWHLIRADPARDEAGQIVRWFGTSADIEQQKRAEEALEEADRRKDEFLAILAHELRNPLAPIVSSLDTLRTQVAAAPLEKQAWSVIDRQVGRLTRLVDDLLDISRVTRGKLDLQRRVMDLTAVATSAVESVRPQFAARGHELTLHLPPEPIRVFGDPARLEQVLTNVLTNAARYTLDGGHIGLSVESAGGDAILRVKDDGIGIPSEMLSRIFIPFTQVESSTSRGSGGLGIGLAVVRMLVELHGGSVDARSPGLGQGTEITVRLPTLSDAQPTEELSTEAPARILEHTSRRILIVDDNADAAQSLATALELSGHRVSVAYDGPSAIEVAIAERPDIIFLDIGLPGMDGYEVAAALRQRAELCHARIVAVTGYGQDRDRQRTRDAGFDQHVVKPVNLNDLWDLLERLTERPS
jgi:two-component system CheB/CheR fusion protein